MMKHCFRLAVAMAAVGFSIAAAHAQDTPSLPDPASITVPDLSNSSDPVVLENGWKYFFFHRRDTSFAEAHADITDCYRFLSPASWANVKLPRFVPWDDRAAVTFDSSRTWNYGLVGELIGGMVEGTLMRRDRQSKMRLCMETRGYTRFGVAEEIWENVIAKPPEEAIAIQAKLASGPLWNGKVPLK